MVATVIPVPVFDLIIFGATGDLSRRQIIPALYHRFIAGQMPHARIIGSSKTEMSQSAFQTFAKQALLEFVSPSSLNPDKVDDFLKQLDFVQIDLTGDVGWDKLQALLGNDKDRIRAFYLSISSALFGAAVERLVQLGFSTKQTRIIVEKPLGHDLASSQTLNTQLSNGFDESQIYRIDHYLGKETVQNLMALRFANSLFEPLWNSQYIDHVQITVAEDIGVGGRGDYYDQSGAMRDMVQNHLMQLLCLTAMEPPHEFEADAVRDEKLKVIKALKPITDDNIETHVVRGQYRSTTSSTGYLYDVGNPKSNTESFVALKAEVANWRWSGTPFYLRTGKRLHTRMTEIAIMFKDTPHSIFGNQSDHFHGNALVLRLQPEEAITLHMTIKDPGPGGMRLREVSLDMSFHEELQLTDADMPKAYERLIMDVIRGNQTLFMRFDEVETAWKWTDPILEAWKKSARQPEQYDQGSSGPEGASILMQNDGRQWRSISL